jgi:putative Mn2+ efflux pump MntP
MSDRTIGMVLVVVGILSLLADIFAVQLGLSQGGPFGLKRELLLAVGIILTGAGLWFLLLKKKKS